MNHWHLSHDPFVPHFYTFFSSFFFLSLPLSPAFSLSPSHPLTLFPLSLSPLSSSLSLSLSLYPPSLHQLHICVHGPDMGSAVMICGVLFSISSVADNLMTPKFFHFAFFYSGLLIQLYTNCYFGSQLSAMVIMTYIVLIVSSTSKWHRTVKLLMFWPILMNSSEFDNNELYGV